MPKFIVREYRKVLIRYEVTAKDADEAADLWANADGGYCRDLKTRWLDLVTVDCGFFDVGPFGDELTKHGVTDERRASLKRKRAA